MAKLETIDGANEHKVVSRKAWITARRRLLVEEKKFTHQRDRLNQRRRNLPWVKVDKDYVFEGPNGKETLAELFCGRRQLVVYHFMFGPGWKEGCPHCSFWADHFDGVGLHLGQRDTTLVVVSHAPWKEIARFKKRMGWKFKWVSSFQSEFNFDYCVSFTPEDIRAGRLFYNYANTAMKISEPRGFCKEICVNGFLFWFLLS